MRIKCRLEYLHESHNTFFPCVLFDIGNRKRCDIALPKRKLAASVWRIVLLDPLGSLRDLELELDDTDIVFDDLLNPKTIIGCIRIDTIFSVRNIPIVQANLRVNRLSLAILNNVCILNHQVPDLLQQYSLKVEEHVRNTQEFCAINFTEINASVALHVDMEWKVYNEFTFDVSIFDSSYLTMNPFIERVPIKCYIEHNTLGQPNIGCVTAGKLRIRYGPSIGSAIAIAEQIWLNILRDVESKNRLPIMTRFVVCNSTSVAIKFGQDHTDEQIWLQQNECFYYAFRAINLPQKIRFSVRLESRTVDVADACVVDDRENIDYFAVVDGKYLLISSRKVSTTQRQIMVKGQIDVLNMTKETFQIHYKTKGDSADDATVKNQCGILLTPSANSSILEACNDTREAFVRLQLAGGDANGWSGEIPLNRPASTIPWIVKGKITIDGHIVTAITNCISFCFSSDEIIAEIHHVHGSHSQRIHRVFIAWATESTTETNAHCHLAIVHGSFADANPFDCHRHRTRQTVFVDGKGCLSRPTGGRHLRYGSQFYVSTAERS